jgi:hypothetical protein
MLTPFISPCSSSAFIYSPHRLPKQSPAAARCRTKSRNTDYSIRRARQFTPEDIICAERFTTASHVIRQLSYKQAPVEDDTLASGAVLRLNKSPKV